jgi:hypothetical protein
VKLKAYQKLKFSIKKVEEIKAAPKKWPTFKIFASWTNHRNIKIVDAEYLFFELLLLSWFCFIS